MSLASLEMDVSKESFMKMTKLFSKTNDSIKKILSKTGLGRSGHVQFQTFGPIWHVSGPKIDF